MQSGRNLIKSRKNTVVDKIVIMRRNRFLLDIKSYISLKNLRQLENKLFSCLVYRMILKLFLCF
jgi:hypothetical protein